MVLKAFIALFVPCFARPPTVTLRNGVEMPLISAGVYQYNSSEAHASIASAIKVGFTALDTALDYWNQDGVGAALKEAFAAGLQRDQIFVESKVPGCANPAENTTRNPLTCYSDTQKNLERDLKFLGLPYVDLVIIHFPPFPSFAVRSCNEITGSCGMARAQWKALVEFYKAGKAKAIGVSNYCPSCFNCLKDTDVFPMVNQVMMHAGTGVDPGNIVSYGKSMGVVTQAYSALGNTPWTHHAEPEILKGNLTTAIAKAHNVSTVQVALKFLVEAGIPAVTKSSSPSHLASDLDLWSWNLTEEEAQKMNDFRINKIFDKYSFACSSMEEAIVV